MGRRFNVTSRQVAVIDPFTELEERARAKYLRGRLIGGTNYVVPDHVFYPAADKALQAGVESSIEKPKT